MKALSTLLLVLAFLAGCAAQPVPYPERIVFPPLDFSFPEVERSQLASGAQLYTKQDTELPLVELTLMIPGGRLNDPTGQEGMVSLLAAGLRNGGFGDRSPEEVDLLLEQKAAQITVSATDQTLNVQMSLRAQDLDLGLELLNDLLQKPGFDQQRLEVVRGQMIEGVRRQNDNPGNIARRLLDQAVYGEHPLGRAVTVDSLRSIKRAALIERYRGMVNPETLWLGVSGDFEPDRLKQRLDAMWAGWTVSAAKSQAAIAAPTASKQPMMWVVDKKIPQTTIVMGDLGITKDAPDLYAVRVMNYILGGGGFNSKLMREVRSNRGLAYSVYSFFQVGRTFPGKFVASAETKTESTVEVIELMRGLMDQMSTSEVQNDSLDLAKDSLINSFIFAFEGTHPVVEQQMRLDYYNYPSDYMQTYRTRVASVTADQVRQAAKDRVQTGRHKIVLVGDLDVLKPLLDQAGYSYQLIDVDTQ